MKPRAAVLPRRPRPSATVAPELTFDTEAFAAIANELPPLFVRYGEEFPKVDGVVSDPDWAALYRMAMAGTLRVVTARDAGLLVGFAFNVVGPHLMYKGTCHGITNAIWLDPAYRIGWQPMKFLRANLEFLKSWGVKRACIGEDAAKPRSLAKVYERLGYRLTEQLYDKVL